MRVLSINKFHYRRGGAETAYFAHADLLARHGHDVIPFSMQHPQNEPTPYARYFVSNVELRDRGAGLRTRVATAGRMLYSREAAQKVDALVRETRPDVAHVHNVYHQLSPSILPVLAKRGVPVVLTMHDYKLFCPAYTMYANGAPCERCKGGAFYNAALQGCVKGSRAASILCAAEAYLHSALGLYRKHVTTFIAPSRFLATKAVEFGMDASRIEVIPNFVDAPDMVDQPDRKHVLYTGRLERVKGVHTLIEAFSRSSLAASTELVIAGDGEDRASLEAHARSIGAANVRFTGHVTADEVHRLLDDALFTVAPSEWYENAPLSVMEAASHGRACVVSDMGGLPELVRHGETGIVFRASDVAALTAAIDGLLADPQRARAMGSNARAFMQERFSPDRHYEQLMGLYERVSSAKSQQRTAKAEVAV
jgi:glycosyltransferase involved in cell wall biosynthesis